MANAARQTYQKLDQREHVLARPGMYVGSVEPDTYSTWVYDGERMVHRDVRFAPGLYKIFDEILVNALDQVKRLRTQKAKGHDVVLVRSIKVDVDKEAGTIQVVNDGDGVDVDVDPKTGLLIPEMVFGHLLTSANYAEKDKTVGGQNGIGAKATNIFSTEFHVETIDHRRGKVYRQTWKDNMSRAGKADVRSNAKKSQTLVRFRPDFARFGETGISDDLFQLIHKRVYDAAAVSGSDVSVAFNGQRLEVKTFEKYVDMYVGAKDEHARVHEVINDNWEVVVTHSASGSFDQVSFVNGIWTLRGGKHVEHIANQVVTKLGDLIAKKNKGSSVKSSHIRNNLFLFVNCTIGDPSFDGQSKETLTTPASKFGAGKVEVSDKLIEKIYKSSGLMDRVLELVEASDANLAKKTDGKKKASVRGLVKLDDANFAGTAKSASCTLMLTEGDSARSTAIAGLAVVGRDTYGVFPLRGKVLNTLDISAKKVAENEEITNLKKILGLESGRKYTSLNELRYGRIMVCTDQDSDGWHIRGLLFNLFSSLWPSLIQQEGFLCSLSTPLIKVSGGKYTQPIAFYNKQDYDIWQANQRPADIRAAKVKYYKGLGSSGNAEAQEYFRQLKTITYDWTGGDSKEALDLAFNKKRADDRKAWLAQYDREATLDYNKPRATFEEFVHKELIHFSSYDVDRSIPNLMDGLKTSQRKVLHACFKRDLKEEMKVAQLTGYTAQTTGYHHGEAALNGTIIGMAQDFVGSNNINLLQPIGQFGSRLAGGKDAAAPRYIFTCLSSTTRKVYIKEDEQVLEYLDDEGMTIEPKYFAPIIPMVLVNGATGIATAFSTSIPSHDPRELIAVLRLILEHGARDQPDPKIWYRGHKGGIEEDASGKLTSVGVFTRTGPTKIKVTELPIMTWTEDFKQLLEDALDSKAGLIKNYKSNYDNEKVDFDIEFASAQALDDLMASSNASTGYSKLHHELKLISTRALQKSNMYLFDAQGRIKKYATTMEIVNDFVDTRLELYDKRKQAVIASLKNNIKFLEAKARFINEVITKKVTLSDVKRADVEAQLQKGEYPTLEDGYEYLLRMPMSSLTHERKLQLEAEAAKARQELTKLQKTSPKDMWLAELAELEAAL